MALAVALSLTAPFAPSAAEPAKQAPSASASAAPAGTASAAEHAKEKRERQERAGALFDEAKALYERGLYRRAIAKLEAALALDPEGVLLVYNLALLHEKLVEPEIAEKYYLRYIEMETDAKARERAVAIVKRLQSARKSLKADIQERALAASASASATASGTAAATARPVSRLPSPMVLVLGGVAAAAAGVGVGFGISALSTHPDGLTTGPRTTSYDLEARAQSAHTQAVIADLAFATSFVVGAATAVLYLLETRPRSAAPAPAPSTNLGSAPQASRFRVEIPF